jgi:hypothetical protein
VLYAVVIGRGLLTGWLVAYSDFQLRATSDGSADVSPADKQPRKSAKMAALLGLIHVKTVIEAMPSSGVLNLTHGYPEPAVDFHRFRG